MNINSIGLACSICNDIRRYNSEVNEIKRINIHLSGMVISKHIIENEVRNWINKNNINFITIDSYHPHFMCGHCLKANLGELHSAEERLRRTLYKIAYIIFTEHNSELFYETTRIISGRYPATCRILHNMYNKEFKNK